MSELPTDHVVDVQISVRVEKVGEGLSFYRATSQLVPGMSTYGRTADEALTKVRSVMADLAKAEHKDDWVARRSNSI